MSHLPITKTLSMAKCILTLACEMRCLSAEIPEAHSGVSRAAGQVPGEEEWLPDLPQVREQGVGPSPRLGPTPKQCTREFLLSIQSSFGTSI